MATSAGYIALVDRDWDIPQGADTVNAFRYGTQASSVAPIVYPALVTDGWTARAQIRSAVGKDVWVDFSSASASGPRISLDNLGNVIILLPSATTEAIAWNTRVVGFYDLELIEPSGTVIRLARGTVTVYPDITRI